MMDNPLGWAERVYVNADSREPTPEDLLLRILRRRERSISGKRRMMPSRN
jgi:hypothetical protein